MPFDPELQQLLRKRTTEAVPLSSHRPTSEGSPYGSSFGFLFEKPKHPCPDSGFFCPPLSLLLTSSLTASFVVVTFTTQALPTDDDVLQMTPSHQ